LPSVRGRDRLLVALILIGSGALSGGLVGFAAGLAGQLVPSVTLRSIGVLVTFALVLDLVGSRVPAIRPVAVGRQVPVEWGRLFSAPVVAVLYGARLGVGPLTILSTWLWWAATLGAATLSVGASVTVGTLFGFVRLSITALASVRAEQQGHVSWFLRLRSNEKRAWSLLAALALAGAGYGIIAG